MLEKSFALNDCQFLGSLRSSASGTAPFQGSFDMSAGEKLNISPGDRILAPAEDSPEVKFGVDVLLCKLLDRREVSDA